MKIFDYISVIVPIYNAERFLSKCIESILNQTYKNLELILINDGSFDSSDDICRRYEKLDNRVRYFYKENGGVSSARNFGLQMSRGNYIFFVDSDDYIASDMLEKLLVNSSTDFIMCGYQLYDDITNTVTKQFTCSEFFGNRKEFVKKIENYLSPPFLLGPCFKLFKKEIIINNCILFPPELSYGEDAIFVLNYLLHCDSIAIVAYVGYIYRKHGKQTLSGRFLREKIDINDKINYFIYELLNCEDILISDSNRILSNRILECFVSYSKELLDSEMSFHDKHELFYEKYCIYKTKFGKPRRFAQKLVVFIGKYKIFYLLLYVFKIRKV